FFWHAASTQFAASHTSRGMPSGASPLIGVLLGWRGRDGHPVGGGGVRAARLSVFSPPFSVCNGHPDCVALCRVKNKNAEFAVRTVWRCLYRLPVPFRPSTLVGREKGLG